ncbi:MAG: DUF3299 domain-containing protein [Gammaproteobacteria bacterium]
MNYFSNKYFYLVLNFLVVISITSSILFAKEAKELDWDDLAPEGYFENMQQKQQSTLSGIFDNFGDALGFDDVEDDSEKAQQAYDELLVSLRSAPIVPELNGQYIKLAGFIVPLEYDFDNGTFNAFLLAPYFGACIHVPPPPSNQMVYVSSAKPLDQKWLDNAVWVEGTMTTESINSEYGSASYSMKEVKLDIYEE